MGLDEESLKVLRTAQATSDAFARMIASLEPKDSSGSSARFFDTAGASHFRVKILVVGGAGYIGSICVRVAPQ